MAAISLKAFLEESSQNSSQEVKSLVTKIRDWAYHSEDTIESWMYNHLRHGQRSACFPNIADTRGEINSQKEADLAKHLDLQKIKTELDSIMEDVVKIKDGNIKNKLDRLYHYPSRLVPSGQTSMVGFDEDMMQIKVQLCNDQQHRLQIIPIVAMGGIGKTTIARNVYNDPFVVHHFSIRAWITLSQHFRFRDILLRLLEDISMLTNDGIRKESDEKLKESIYKNVKGKRFLVVLDDVWSTNAWNDIKMLFPNDNNGSRILFTTRLSDVAEYVSSPKTCHLMRFMNETESWNLFCQNVFGEDKCPPELEEVGMNISKNCQGLPLLIVVVAGLLLKDNKTKRVWEYVAGNLSSIIAAKDDSCLEILALSYNSLPPHLRPCFLYMGAFPPNYEIPVSRLIKLWVAEGFANGGELAEKCLMELIGRNLILVNQKGSISRKIKSCSMHDIVRELCVRMAHEENFMYVKSKHMCNFLKHASLKHRLCIHDDASYGCTEEDITMQSMDLVRSFIYNGWDDTQLHSYYYFGFRLLRVLDMVGVELGRFPEEILQLFYLRYIAIVCHAEIPSSIVLLWNLQTLIVIDPAGIASKLPPEIWNMKQLRHLKFSRVSLPLFSPGESFPKLPFLETLSGAENFNLLIISRLPFLKKFGIHCNPLSFQSALRLHYLEKLETLKVIFDSPADSTFLKQIRFPRKLRKLTLEGGSIDWEHMKIFGRLQNLEVLKLRGFTFRGQEWSPKEGEFLNLKYLLICETDLEHWRAEDTHFPSLEHLILRSCSNLKIPLSIGEIMTLQIIEIDDSSPDAVESAKQILEYHREQGNDNLQVFFHPTKANFYPLKFGVKQDRSGRFYRRKTKLDSLKAKVASGSSSKA